jgi:MFS family permease
MNDCQTPAAENVLIEESKKRGHKEGASWSLMDGFGLRYIAPFAVAVGASNNQIGFLTSLPSFFGSLAQLFSLKAMNHRSRKSIALLCVLAQASTWFLLIAVGAAYFLFDIKSWKIPTFTIVIYTTIIIFGAMGHPPWASWMKDLVKKDIGQYFGKRASIVGLIAISGMLIAGFILDYFRQTQVFWGFLIIFLIASLGRYLSAYFLKRQYEPPFECDNSAYFSLWQFLQKMAGNNFGRFTIMLSLFTMATQIASPFMAVYMLKDLQFSYVQFTIVNLTSTLTTLLLMPVWGRIIDRFGSVRIMRSIGPVVSIVPILWLMNPLFTNDSKAGTCLYLALVQSLTGAAWAGFDLAAGNFIYNAVTRQRMAICVTYYGILIGVGTLIGTSIGGYFSSFNQNIFGLKPIFFVFVLSGVCRLAISFYFNNKIREVRPVEEFRVEKLGWAPANGVAFFRYVSYFTTKIFRRPFQ